MAYARHARGLFSDREGDQPADANPPYCYLPSGRDAGWKAAKANKAYAPAQVAIMGDSWLGGFTPDLSVNTRTQT